MAHSFALYKATTRLRSQFPQRASSASIFCFPLKFAPEPVYALRYFLKWFDCGFLPPSMREVARRSRAGGSVPHYKSDIETARWLRESTFVCFPRMPEGHPRAVYGDGATPILTQSLLKYLENRFFVKKILTISNNYWRIDVKALILIQIIVFWFFS